MIDFRYHVVSIAAIFLALTIGLVIGASILSKSLADNLRGDISKANDQISSQQDQIKQLRSQIDQENTYITETAGALVDNRLNGLCVALVQIAGADSGAYSATRTMLQKQAGATICSETTINASFTSPDAQDQLAVLVQELTPSGQKLAGTLDQQAAALVAEALTTYQATGTTPEQHSTSQTGTMTATEALTTLKDFENIGLITLTLQPVAGEQASLAYVQAPASANQDAENQTYLALAEGLHKAGAGTMVGGSGQSAQKGGLLYAIQSDQTATRQLTTVDDTDLAMGQVASVFCLADLAQGTSAVAGHYGTGANDDGPVPSIPSGLG